MRAEARERLRIVSALGVIQILAWGSSFYLLAVLADPIVADTGWSRTAVVGGVSVGLLCSAAVAMIVGRAIDRIGGRPVVAGGMALIALGLAILAAAPSVAIYLAAWAVIGVGMGAGLYDAAFSTLGRIYGKDGRRAITTLTLWGGFASTVCWPLTAFAVEHLGWRGACLGYVALHLFVTLPLALFVLPREARKVERAGAAGAAPSARAGGPLFWLLAVAATTMGVAGGIWSMHLISILQAQGMALAAAVGLGALVGPSQVGGRILEMASGGRHHPIWTLSAAALLVALGLSALAFGAFPAAALIAFGAGNGIWSIGRGTVPLALFGPEGYAALMGRLATPVLVAGAIAPSAGAALMEATGPQALLWALAGLGLVNLLCVGALAVSTVRRGRASHA